ncbi:MAG: HAD family phosphatase [Lachnospiraceae bacterium]|nr:HAD family phosphatase [Lachnospiraceae bacterium]
MIKNIIFDIGNVLAHFRWAEYLQFDKGYDRAMVERIGKASVMCELWAEFDRGVYTDEEIVQLFVDRDPGIEKELHDAFDYVKGMVTPFDYAKSWIQSYKDRGFKVWFLSNFSNKCETQCPESLSFMPLMDGGILSYKEKMVKPNPEIYKRLLEKCGIKAEESIFIDDTVVNIEEAERQGIHGVVFKSHEQAIADAEKIIDMEK